MQLLKTLGGALFLLFVASAFAGEPTVIKFSHVLTADTPKGLAALRFKRLAEEKTGGRVRVDIFPNSELYGDREELQALQSGTVQMLAPSLSKFEPLGVREFALFDLPYLFPSREALHAVMDGEVGAGLLRKLEAKHIIGLAYWDNGFKHLSANWPLRAPADCKGLKMRVQSSKVLEAQMKALGASPVVMSFNETRAALATGELDGTENPLSNMYASTMHEVQRHLTLTGHGYLGYAVIVNRTFWDALAPDLRSILEEAMRETTRYQRELAYQESEQALAKIRAAGTTRVHVPSAHEREAWRRALVPVHRQFEKIIGRERLTAVYAITAP